MMTDNIQNTQEERLKLIFSVRLRQRYHSRRTAFYRRCSRIPLWATVTGICLIVLLSSPGFELPGMDIQTLRVWIAGIVTTLVLAWLPQKPDDLADRHSECKIRYAILENDICSDKSNENFEQHQQRYRELANNSLPSRNALNVLCFNQEAAAQGDKAKGYKVPYFQRITAQFFAWENIANHLKPISHNS